MPELPEVETTRRGISASIMGAKICRVVVRHHQLRFPVRKDLSRILMGQTIHDVGRRGKYLLLKLDTGVLIIHLGMSGKLCVVDAATAASKHDHCDIIFSNGLMIRYNDPRRFGAILWTEESPEQHALLKNLGPEPLTRAFNVGYLWQACLGKKTNIKALIMDSHVVVGVGNIYANEALFLAKIHPMQMAAKLKQAQVKDLVVAIKLVLKKAIKAGGTTLKDFLQSDGRPGYFAQKLKVYGRAGEACFVCGARIALIRHQRASYFCPHCQRL